MTFFKSIGILLLALILQTSVVRLLAIGPIKPDLVIIALVGVALRYGPLVGLYSGLLIGIIADIYAIEHLGAHSLALCLVGYLVGIFFNERIIRIVQLTRLLILGAAFLAHDFIYSFALGLRENAWHFLLERSLPTGVYTLLLGWILFFLLAHAPLEEK